MPCADDDELSEDIRSFIKQLKESLVLVPEPNKSRMLANRSAFLRGAELATAQKAPKAFVSSFWQRLLWQSCLLFISLLGTRIEQDIEARRRQEVYQLVTRQGEAKVDFEGILEQSCQGWQIIEPRHKNLLASVVRAILLKFWSMFPMVALKLLI